MNLLCPTDFSNASVNACRWAVHFLDQLGGGTLRILHCIDVISRSAMFINLSEIYRERAEADLRDLAEALQPISAKVQIRTQAVQNDPKSFITDHTNRHGYDLVVTGTKGLSALKNMTVGSVTAYLMEHVRAPVLAVPDERAFRPVHRIVLGVENKNEIEEAPLKPLLQLLGRTEGELYVAHVELKGGVSSVDTTRSVAIGQATYPFFTLREGGSVPEALNQFSVARDADMLVMVHRRRAWFARLFHASVTKAELFDIQVPLLILPC